VRQVGVITPPGEFEGPTIKINLLGVSASKFKAIEEASHQQRASRRDVAQNVSPTVSQLDHACAVRPGASARHAARRAADHAARRRLLHLCCASGCLGTSCGSSSTTSPTMHVRVPRHVARLVVDHAPSRHSISCRSIALALAVRPVIASRGATTRRPDCTGSTAPMPCIRTRHLAAQFLVGRSHLLSSCVWSLCLAARLLVVQITPALLRLCRASGRTVSLSDFSSVGRTGSRHASGHCVSQRDYSSSGLHRLYCAYAVHPDAPSRPSTSRRSVVLALAVRPVTVSRGATTRHPDCTGSTEGSDGD
jgi:hypothetical protein